MLADDTSDGGEEPKIMRGHRSSVMFQVVIVAGQLLPREHVLEQEIQEPSNPRRVIPVPLEISNDRELGHDVDTSIPHPSIGEVGSAGIEGPRSIGVGENRVTGLKQGERHKHRADLRVFSH